MRDAERTLEAAARSILDGSLGDLELVVVDDGSSDASALLLERLAAADARLVLLRQAPAGIVAALERARDV